MSIIWIFGKMTSTDGEEHYLGYREGDPTSDGIISIPVNPKWWGLNRCPVCGAPTVVEWFHYRDEDVKVIRCTRCNWKEKHHYPRRRKPWEPRRPTPWFRPWFRYVPAKWRAAFKGV